MAISSGSRAVQESSDVALFDGASALPRWFTAAALRPVHDVNRQMLALLRMRPAPLAIPDSLATELMALPQEALDRIACSPCLLVDMGFHDDRRWRCAKQLAEHSEVERSDRPLRLPEVVALAQATLFVAWHFAHAYPDAAELVIGTSAASAEAIGELSPQQLQQLASAHSEWIAPRWALCQISWQRLLAESQTNIAPFTGELKVLQLVLGERWRSTTNAACGLPGTAASRLKLAFHSN